MYCAVLMLVQNKIRSTIIIKLIRAPELKRCNFLQNYTLKKFFNQVSKKHFINVPVRPGVSMSHNLLFIGFLSVSPLIVFLCLLITCSRAVISNVDLRQTRQPSTLPDQQPVIPQRRSRTQATLRSEFELSKYQNPIIKCPEKQEN